jgi:hypothetical protein
MVVGGADEGGLTMIQRAQDPDQPGHPGLGGELKAEILEPHASLRYVARLFKWLAALLLLLLVAETVLGLVQQGQQALPVLLVEATRLIVFAGVLWAFGDIALMLIESNHDLRATRLMVWQLNALMKMRMENEGIHVDPVRPALDPRQRTNISEE